MPSSPTRMRTPSAGKPEARKAKAARPGPNWTDLQRQGPQIRSTVRHDQEESCVIRNIRSSTYVSRDARSGNPSASWPSAACCASTAATAVMFTTPRAVVDGVQDVRRARRTDQNRPDRQRVAEHLHHLVADIGGVDVRHDQHVRLAAEARMRIDALAEHRHQRGLAVHLAVDLEIGRLPADQARAPRASCGRRRTRRSRSRSARAARSSARRRSGAHARPPGSPFRRFRPRSGPD